MENRKKAERILAALDNSKASISWHRIDEEDLILAIVRELNRIDKEETAGVG